MVRWEENIYISLWWAAMLLMLRTTALTHTQTILLSHFSSSRSHILFLYHSLFSRALFLKFTFVWIWHFWCDADCCYFRNSFPTDNTDDNGECWWWKFYSIKLMLFHQRMHASFLPLLLFLLIFFEILFKQRIS